MAKTPDIEKGHPAFDIIRYLAAILLISIPIIVTPQGLALTVKNPFVHSDIVLINIFRIASIIIGIALIFSKKINEFMKHKTKNIPLELKVFMFICLIIIIFAVLHLMTLDSRVLGYYLNLDGEHNIPAWFSSVLLFAAALLSFVSAIIIKDDRCQKNFWSFMTILFTFLSMDEMIQIHESITRRISIDHWFYVGGPIILIMFAAIIYIAIKSDIEEDVRKYILLGIGLAIIGAVGFEIIGRYFLGEASIYYGLEVMIEECFEMLGVAVIIYALVKNVKLKYKSRSMISHPQ